MVEYIHQNKIKVKVNESILITLSIPEEMDCEEFMGLLGQTEKAIKPFMASSAKFGEAPVNSKNSKELNGDDAKKQFADLVLKKKDWNAVKKQFPEQYAKGEAKCRRRAYNIVYYNKHGGR